MRIRSYPESNYRAIFFNGKTIRQKFNTDLPFTTPQTPELEDVAINEKCLAACPYCYTSALKTGRNFDNILEKADEVWGSLPANERPFQIAIGGAGESTMHPDWVPFVTRVRELGILPNYTTNGMHLSSEILKATEEVCGGVAVSYHPHIAPIFHRAIDKLSKIDTKLNAHIIVGENNSDTLVKELYERYNDVIEYFVLLPYQAAGRAKEIETHDNWKKVFDYVSTVDSSKFAFGALFYEWLKENDVNLEMSIYEPEMFSGYRLMDESYKMLRKSSYDLREKNA